MVAILASDELPIMFNDRKFYEGGSSMSDQAQCPICGKMVDPNEMQALDNGNYACEECVRNEQEKESENN